MRFRFTTLRRRLMVLLVLPVGVLMLGGGTLGFVFARGVLLDRWQETALLSLQRAAHSIDMRVDNLVNLVRLLGGLDQSSGAPPSEDWLLDHIRSRPGVVKAGLKWTQGRPVRPRFMGPGMHGGGWPRGGGPMRRMWHRVRVTAVTSPRYDTTTRQRVVSLSFDLKDDQQKTIGRLTVTLRFAYLLQDIVGLAWWKSHDVCLVDARGRILTSRGEMWRDRTRLGQGDRPFEDRVLRAMGRSASGTLLGSGHPAHLVAGFRRLTAAPWTILLLAPGEKVLAPIVRFRNYFFLSVLAGLALIILIIWLATKPVVASVTEVAGAAGRVAQGDYGPPLHPRTADEAGRLVESFNAMVEGLRERDFIRDTFGRYVDPRVARDLVGRPGATALGGQKRSVAIMMTDIRGFTALCESLEPETTINVVNRYLSGLIEVIQLFRGIIVDFLGDSILVMFDPLDGPLAPAVRDAVCCALEMQRRAADLNARDKTQGLPEIFTGIGVHAGEVVVGNIGSEARTKYGLIGAPVNFTHRLQAEAEGGQIVVSDVVREILATNLKVARTFAARLKGIPEAVNLHVVEDLADCRPPDDGGGED